MATPFWGENCRSGSRLIVALFHRAMRAILPEEVISDHPLGRMYDNREIFEWKRKDQKEKKDLIFVTSVTDKKYGKRKLPVLCKDQ